MKANFRYIVPALASIALTASLALAQVPGAGSRPPRTQPTAAQMEARRQQMCADQKAREAANFTYVEQRLKLTAAQMPLFERWKSAQESVQTERQANCGKAPAASNNQAANTQAANGQRQRPTLTQRNARMEDMLKQRLADLEKTSPPQEALYNALSDDQKKLFEQGNGRGRMGMRGGRGSRMAFAGQEFGQGRGFGGRGFGPGRPGFGPGRGFGPGGRPNPNAPTPPAQNGG